MERKEESRKEANTEKVSNAATRPTCARASPETISREQRAQNLYHDQRFSVLQMTPSYPAVHPPVVYQDPRNLQAAMHPGQPVEYYPYYYPAPALTPASPGFVPQAHYIYPSVQHLPSIALPSPAQGLEQKTHGMSQIPPQTAAYGQLPYPQVGTNYAYPYPPMPPHMEPNLRNESSSKKRDAEGTELQQTEASHIAGAITSYHDPRYIQFHNYQRVNHGKMRGVNTSQVESTTKQARRRDNEPEATDGSRKSSSKKRKRRESNQSSRYRGVYFCTASNSWRARIWHNGKSQHLGCYASERDAAKAYDKRAKELLRKKLNFDEENVKASVDGGNNETKRPSKEDTFSSPSDSSSTAKN